MASVALFFAIRADKNAKKAMVDRWVEMDDSIKTDKIIQAKGFVENE